MKGEAPSLSSKEMAQIRQNLEGTPDIEEAAELMNLAGNSSRLKLIYLLETMNELSVSDLAEMLGISVSAVSQHLAKLKAYGLVAPRRDAQTIYYRLTGHEFNAKLRVSFLLAFERCFPAWSRVSLPGGRARPIAELCPGDLVCSWDVHRGAPAESYVTRVVTGTAALLFRINSGLTASGGHRLLTERGYVRCADLRVGDLLFRFPGTETEQVSSIEVLAETSLVYNLDVTPHATFFADGLLVEDFSGFSGDEDAHLHLPAFRTGLAGRLPTHHNSLW